MGRVAHQHGSLVQDTLRLWISSGLTQWDTCVHVCTGLANSLSLLWAFLGRRKLSRTSPGSRAENVHLPARFKTCHKFKDKGEVKKNGQRVNLDFCLTLDSVPKITFGKDKGKRGMCTYTHIHTKLKRE